MKKNKLTKREMEVARWLVKGKTVQDVATILGIKTGTAESHRAAIYEKLDITSRAQLAQEITGFRVILNPVVEAQLQKTARAAQQADHEAFTCKLTQQLLIAIQKSEYFEEHIDSLMMILEGFKVA